MREIFHMHAFIKGKVQGVGFRYETLTVAKSLGITGTVHNLPDGRVEIFAHGPKPSLEKLMNQLKNEVFPDHIEEAIIEFYPIKTPPVDFRIIH